MVVPVYNAELAPKNLRGRLVSLNQLFITAGIMVSLYMHSDVQSGIIAEKECDMGSLSQSIYLFPSLSVSLSVSPSLSLSLLSFFIFCIVG